MSEYTNRFDETLLAFERGEVKPLRAEGLSKDERLQIRWKIPFGLSEEAVNWVKANRRTVSKFKTPHKEYEGPFRSISVEVDHSESSKVCYLVQEFAYGWLQSVVSGSDLDWTEARLISNRELPAGKVVTDPVVETWGNPEQYLLFRWEGVDPKYAERFVDEINGLTDDDFDPVVDGEAYTEEGTDSYTRLYCAATIDWESQDPDRSTTVDLLVAKPRFNLSSVDSYGTKLAAQRYDLYNVPKYIAQEIINLYNASVGASVDPKRENENGLIDIQILIAPTDQDAEEVITAWSCSEKQTTSYYYNIPSPLPDVVSPSSGIWYTSSWQINFRTGLYNGYQAKHEALVTTLAEFTSEVNAASSSIRQAWQNLRGTEGNYTDESGTPIVPPSMTQTDGKVKRTSKRKNNNCTTDLEYAEETVSDQEATSATNSVVATATTATHTQNSTEASAAGSTAGTIVSSRNSPTPFGKFQTERTETTSIPLTFDQLTVGQKFDTEQHIRYGYAIRPNDVTAWLATAFSTPLSQKEVGKKKALNMSRNSDGSFNLTASQSDSSTITDDLTVVIGANCNTIDTYYYFWNYTKADLQAALAVFEAINPGHSRRLSVSRNNDDGTFDATLIDTEANPDLPDITLSYQISAEISVVETYKYLLTYTEFLAWQAAIPSWATGTNQSVQFTKVLDGCYYNTVRTVRTVIDQLGSSLEDAHNQSGNTVTHTQGIEITSVTASAGETRQARSVPTPFGKFQTVDETITAKNQSVTEYLKNHSQSSTIARETQGTEATDPTLVAGTAFRVRQRPTPFGKVSKEYETIIATDQLGHEDRDSHAVSAEADTHTQGDDISSPSAALGQRKRLVVRPTEFGKFQTMLETETAKNQTASEWVKNHAQVSYIDSETQGTAATEPTLSAGTSFRVRQTPTDFGKFRREYETITATDQAGGAGADDASQSSEVLSHTQGAILTAPSATTGTRVNRRWEPTQFGLFKTIDEVTTTKDQTGGKDGDRHDQSETVLTHTQGAILSAPTAAIGTIVERTSNPTSFGLFQTTDRVLTAKNQTSQDAEDTHARSTIASENTQGSALSVPVAAIGTIVRKTEEPTAFGKFRTRSEVITAKDQEGHEDADNHAVSSTAVTQTQGSDIIAPTAAVGERKRLIVRPTEFGKFQTLIETETAKDQTSTDRETTHAQTSVTDEHTQGIATVPPSVPVGTIKRSSEAPTPFGKFQTREETITAIDQTGGQGQDRHDQSTTVDTHTQTTALSIPTAPLGSIIDRVWNPTPFGLFSTTDRTTTAKNQIGSAGRDDASQSVLTATNSQATTILPPPTAAVGTRVETRSAPTSFGRFATIQEIITTKDQTTSDLSDGAAETSVTLKHTQGPEITSVVATAGEIVTLSQNQTSFGKFKTSLQTRTAIDQAGTQFTASAARSVSATSNTQASVSLPAPTPAAGTKSRRVSIPTIFGRFRTFSEDTTVNDQESESSADAHMASSATTVHTSATVPLPTASAATGTTVRRQNMQNEVGQYETVETVTTGIGIITSVTSLDGTVTITAKNQLAGVLQTTINGYSASLYEVTNTGEEPAAFEGMFNWRVTAKYTGLSLDPEVEWTHENQHEENFKTYKLWTPLRSVAEAFMVSTNPVVGGGISRSGGVYTATRVEWV